MRSMSRLAENLQKLIRERRLRMSDVARETGISPPVIHRLCAGTTLNPNVETLRPLADFFNVSINQLISHECITYQPRIHSLNIVSWDELLHTSFFSIYALKVEDSAMHPQFMKNTIILVDPQLNPNDHDYVIVHYVPHKKPVFKQLLKDGETVYFRSHHPELKPVKPKNYRILGTVIEARIPLASHE